MRKWAFNVLVYLLAMAILVACGPGRAERDAESTEIAVNIFATQMAQVPTSTSTPTSTSVPTDIPTATPTSTATATSLPTETPSPTSSPTVTLPPTATPVPPTPVPTSPPLPLEAHVFPETPIQPFDADVFLRYLGLVRDSFRSAADEFPRIFSGAKSGDCGSYGGWFALWITEAPGFQDVPVKWDALYVEYRSLLQQVVFVTWEIHEVCSSGGGTVSDETDAASQNFIDWAYPRFEAMIIEAHQLSQP